MDYKNAGVDIEAGYKSVELMKEYVKGTARREVLGGIGGFSGAFSAEALKGMEKPVLLSGTDGVGTKLKLAFLMDRHDTVGIDCVAMCVNDVACAGGEPLFFLDYIACGRNIPEKIAAIVKGVAQGCSMAGAALVGGETAEHPDLMPEEEYDLAGKTIIPFITHGGSRASRTVETIAGLQTDAQVWDDPLVLSRNDVASSADQVTSWAEGLGLTNQ